MGMTTKDRMPWLAQYVLIVPAVMVRVIPGTGLNSRSGANIGSASNSVWRKRGKPGDGVSGSVGERQYWKEELVKRFVKYTRIHDVRSFFR